MNNTFGVVLPCYNAERTLRRAIDSVLNQTYPYFKLYIIDDKSTDNSLDIINSYEDERIEVINSDINEGVAEARNKGIKSCKEDFIAFIDSDDEWNINKLKLQNSAVSQGNDFIISNYHISDDKKEETISHEQVLTCQQFLKKQFRVCFSSLTHRRLNKDFLFEKIGHEDFLYLFNLFEKYKFCFVVSESLVTYHTTTGSLSSNKLKSAIWHMKILNKIFNKKYKIIYYFFFYTINALKLQKRIR